MAERLSHFARATLKSSNPFSASKLCSSFFFSTKTSLHSKEDVQTKTEKGKWLTLPPFTPTVDASAVAKQLSKSLEQQDTTTTTRTKSTALKWVLRCCPQIPRSLVQKLFRLRQVRRECYDSTSASPSETEAQKHSLRRVSTKDEMNIGDRIFLPASVDELPMEKEKPECNCNADEVRYLKSLELYKDPAILVVNKPHGMPVQGGIGIKNSLDDLAANYLKYEYSQPPRLVHRLDRDSSGILVMGRTKTSATILHSIFREKTFGASTADTDDTKRILERSYWALVIGTPRRRNGIISAPLGKVVLDNGKSERITIVDDTQAMPSQHAVTEYSVIETSRHGYTWLQLCPLTGRKHQLRVHCAEVLGTPIVGDYKYGWQAHRNWEPLHSVEPEKNEKLKRSNRVPFGLDLENGSISEKQPHLHLHSRTMTLPNVSLALQHMKSSKNLNLSNLQNIELAAPLPSHMQRSWDILRS